MTMLDENTAVISVNSASGVTLWTFDLTTNEVTYQGILKGVSELAGLYLMSTGSEETPVEPEQPEEEEVAFHGYVTTESGNAWVSINASSMEMTVLSESDAQYTGAGVDAEGMIYAYEDGKYVQIDPANGYAVTEGAADQMNFPIFDGTASAPEQVVSLIDQKTQAPVDVTVGGYMHYVTEDDWYTPYLVKLFDYEVPTIQSKYYYDFNDMGMAAIAYISSELLADNTFFYENYLVLNTEGNIYKLTEKTKVYGGTRGWNRSSELLAEPYLNVTGGASMTMMDENTAVISVNSASGVTLYTFDLTTYEVAYLGILNGVTDLVGLSLMSQVQGKTLAVNKGTGHLMTATQRTAPGALENQTVTINEGTVNVDLYTAETNGKLIVTFDPEALTYVSATGAAALYSVNDADAEDGQLVIAYAAASALTQNDVLASLVFSYETAYVDTAITVTAEERGELDGLNEQTEIVIDNSLSDDNTLRSLKVAEGELSPIFAPTVNEYAISVPYDVEQLTITAAANDEKASVTVLGNTLVAGETTDVQIIVTAENGDTRTYIIHASREAAHVHTPVTIPGYPATCTEPGMTDGQYCPVCKTVLVEWEVIPALGHNYENGVCTGCGDHDEEFIASPVITASNVASSGKVKLTWDSVEGAVKYQIYRATTKDGEYKLMYTTSGTSYINTKATAGKYYYYYVVAVNEEGVASAPSNIAGRTCDLPRPVVTASNNAKTGKVKLAWEAVEGAVEYKIYRTTERDGKYSHMYTTANTTYTNTNAEAGVTYYYKVVAVAAKTAANSAASAVVSRTCDLPQVKVTGKVNLLGNPKLNWDKVDGAVSYKVYRAESENGEYKLMKTVTGTSYTNTNCVGGTTYHYYVVAVAKNTAANSAASNVIALTAK